MPEVPPLASDQDASLMGRNHREHRISCSKTFQVATPPSEKPAIPRWFREATIPSRSVDPAKVRYSCSTVGMIVFTNSSENFEINSTCLSRNMALAVPPGG